MEWARQRHPVVGLAPADHRAAMGAGIDETVQFAGLVPGDHDRLPADVGGEVVAGVGHLAFVGQVDPVALEDVLDLELEDLLVGEDPPVRAVDACLGVVDDGVGENVSDAGRRDGGCTGCR